MPRDRTLRTALLLTLGSLLAYGAVLLVAWRGLRDDCGGSNALWIDLLWLVVGLGCLAFSVVTVALGAAAGVHGERRDSAIGIATGVASAAVVLVVGAVVFFIVVAPCIG